MPPQPRELTDSYRLERILASSRSGSILRAAALDSGQIVAIKLINPPRVDAAVAGRGPLLASRFLDYAAALRPIRHPNLPRVLDAGVTPDGGAFLVMEQLDGMRFDAGLADDASPERILPLLAQTLDGLAELARHGLGHFNLCPENLFVVGDAQSAGGRQLKLLGLGTALFHLGEPWPEAEGARFRAPELGQAFAGPGTQPDWRADCYSLALTACNVLGATVASGESSGTLVQMVQMPLALSFELANDEALRQILEGCLRQVPAQRPTHAAIRDAFALALGAPLPDGGFDGAPPDPPAARTTPAAMSGSVGATEAVNVLGAGATAGSTATARPPAGDTSAVDWRKALSRSPAPPEPPSWQAAPRTAQPTPAAEPPVWQAPRERASDPLPAAAPGVASSAVRQPAPPTYVPLRSPSPDAADRTDRMDDASGTDGSLLDLFDVPATLPDLDGPLEHGGGSPAGATTAPASQAEMAAALGLAPGGGSAAMDPYFGFDEPAASSAHGFPAFGADPQSPPVPPAAAGFPGVPSAFSPALPSVSGNPPAAFPPATFPPAPAPAAGLSSPSASAGAPAGQSAFPSASPPPAPPTAPAASPPSAAGYPAARASGSGSAASSGASPGIATAPTAGEPGGGDMLSAVDDLLSTLPPPPPVTPPTAPAAAGRFGRAAAGASVAAAPRRAEAGGGSSGAGAAAVAVGRSGPLAALLELPKAVLFGIAGALLVVVLLVGFLLYRHHLASAAAATDAAAGDGAGGVAGADGTAPPAERPGRSAAAKFADARSYLILGRDSDGRVREALREMSYADQAALGEEGCRQLGAIEQTLALAALETLPQDLTNGLRNGDLGALQGIVSVAADRDVPANQKADFERARSLVKLYEQAQAAAAAGDSVQVLEHFHAMEGLSRTLRDPLGLRDKAAVALEADAAALAQDGHYDQAVGRLDPIRRAWPERSGLKDLLKTYETAASSETQQLAILDSVPTFERRRKPSEALDLLRPLKPTPHLEKRILEARQRLEGELATLDAQPPQVVLRDGYALDYSRGTVVTLSFRVTDDYEVKSVRLFARPEGGRMREMTMQKSGLAYYTVEIPPSFHQNGTVQFYVVATDLSGHESTLGTAGQPLELKRQQGFERLLR